MMENWNFLFLSKYINYCCGSDVNELNRTFSSALCGNRH